MVTVTVPATSANVGAGFDSLGLAVSMHNVFTFEESDRIQISSVDGTHVPAGSNNLVYRSARVVYDQLGIPLKGLRITQRNDIPMARGLGSSSACIVAGIMGANALLGDKLTERQMLTLATAIEGHPDNVAPAMLGGFVTSVIDEGQVYSVKKDIDPELAFAAFVPDFRLLTSKARAALPAMVSHKDAVYNLSRAALATAAFCEGNYALLGVATKDVLHQKYRLPLIEGGDDIFELAQDLGAQVLNNRSVELAKKYNVELEVISSINPGPGTIVKEETKVEGMLIKGVAKDTDVAVLTVKDVPDVPGMSFKIFSLLAQKNINVDIILQTTGRDGKKDMSFTVPLGDAESAVAALKNATSRIGGGDVTVDKGCAKVSIVGAGMQSHSGVASTMFEALFNQNINIKMISTSEIKISVIIDEADADKAVAAIHDAFIS